MGGLAAYRIPIKLRVALALTGEGQAQRAGGFTWAGSSCRSAIPAGFRGYPEPPAPPKPPVRPSQITPVLQLAPFHTAPGIKGLKISPGFNCSEQSKDGHMAEHWLHWRIYFSSFLYETHQFALLFPVVNLISYRTADKKNICLSISEFKLSIYE